MLQYKRSIYNSKIAMKCNDKVSKFTIGHQIKYPAASFLTVAIGYFDNDIFFEQNDFTHQRDILPYQTSEQFIFSP